MDTNFSDTWGDSFPTADPDWDLIIASDILLCKFLLLWFHTSIFLQTLESQNLYSDVCSTEYPLDCK